ncbi:uncharacterized protein [Centruroides vittatus]|uniref:uncharacterized protein n=1 Tax=Centruroides vittatus TaxID=120091 RepID=UPI00350F0BC3
MESIEIHSMDGREVSVSRSTLITYSRRIKVMLEPFSNDIPITFYLPYAYENVQMIDEFMKRKSPKFHSLRHAIDVYRSSIRLGMRDLSKYCRIYMIQPYQILNVCTIYEFACVNREYDLQFYCWKKFSNYWNEVFFQNKRALDCDEIVIHRLVSRPMYRTLDEMTIYRIVYEWARRRVNSKTSLRQVMAPFLPNIRFLTMDDGFLNCYVYPEQFLREKEVNAIQYYKATSDSSYIPDSICSRDVLRRNEKLISWYIYCNRRSCILDKVLDMNNKFQFISKIWVKEDCFLIGIKLPISHNSEVGIRVKVKNFIDCDSWKTQQTTCDQNGNVKLNRVIYVQKSSVGLLIAKINEDDIAQSDIRVSNLASRYVRDDINSREETVALSNLIEYVYCNVNLYF